MKLLLASDAVGGVWVYSLELARALKPFGVETVIAIMGPSPSDSRREQARDLQLIDTGLPLDWLGSGPAELRRASEAIADLASSIGANLVQASSAALLAGAAFEQPTVAVQHSCLATWWAAVRGGALPDDFAWRRELVRRGLDRASAVVAPTRAFAAATARTYQLSRPVLAVHNGRRFGTRTALPQGDFVLTAGRLWDEGKNAATLDAAAGRIDVPFEAAGPLRGPNGSTVELRNLRSLREVSEARMAALLAVRPVFASAAVYEPFGLTALEAASSGCALVLSDIATHRELWDGAATFVPPRDGAAFAKAIRSLLDDPDRRVGQGKAASARAQSYTPERMARAMTDIYAGLIAAEPAPSPAREMAGAA
jgi:glycosyltransferase involved in cell wall biosynthesis